jgi:hypothetical protein
LAASRPSAAKAGLSVLPAGNSEQTSTLAKSQSLPGHYQSTLAAPQNIPEDVPGGLYGVREAGFQM